MNTRQPVKWKHANQANAQSQNLREEKRPPALPPIAAEKTPAAAAVSESPKNPAAAALAPHVIDRDQQSASRKIKGLLGPVVFDGTLIVWSIAPRNPKLIIGYKKGTDPQNPLNLYNVLVRENFNFLQGMSVPGPHGKLNVVNQNTYELQGACPRWRGRW